MLTLNTPWRPSVGSNVDFAARLIENQFGDGYRQTLPDGLNTVVRTWKITWPSLPIADAGYIEAFLVAQVGKPFYFTLPREQYGRAWDCKQWSRGYPAGGYDSITATFVERFDLA